MSIKQLPENARPREKAMEHGVKYLSDIELLALLISNGTTKYDVLDIAKKLAKVASPLFLLESMKMKDYMKIDGIGKVKALELLAVFELIKRVNNSKIKSGISRTLDSVERASEYAYQIIGNDNYENFLIVVLDEKLNVAHQKIMYKGTRQNVAINPKEVIGYVLSQEKELFYCFHNHPSGNSKPSSEDIMISNEISIMSRLFGLDMLGHIVVCRNKSFERIEI